MLNNKIKSMWYEETDGFCSIHCTLNTPKKTGFFNWLKRVCYGDEKVVSNGHTWQEAEFGLSEFLKTV